METERMAPSQRERDGRRVLLSVVFRKIASPASISGVYSRNRSTGTDYSEVCIVACIFLEPWTCP
jgi:hypothetical protein